MAAVNNASFASPLADASFAAIRENSYVDGILTYLRGYSTWSLLATVFAVLVAYDQVSYIWRKGSIVGPTFKLPFMGPFLESVNPKWHEYVAKWNSGELSCVSVFHKFVVIASTRDLSRKIFNSPQYVKPCVVDAAHKILGPDNWVFLDGKAHVDFRKGLNGLFSRHYLEMYLPGQEVIYEAFFERFLRVTQEAGGKPVPYMTEFRDMMCAVSCRSFVGNYLPDSALNRIAEDYYLITEALELVNFPVIIPYTKTWYGKRCADMVIAEFAACAAKSKVRMAAGAEVNCTLDAWVKAQIDSARWRDAEAKGLSTEGLTKPSPMIRDFTDFEIGQTIFTFLFASQDATSSACTYLFQMMAQRPDMLDKIREENLNVRGGDRSKRMTMDTLDQLVYTRAVVMELLRYRPPVIMVPYEVKKAFPITDSYTVPKGSMLIPTTYPSLRDPEVYPEPDSFNPERWISGDAEAKGSKNWLVFGTGPHYCIGKVYATNNLILMIGKASMELDWVHHPTPLSEVIKVFATIFPKDDCPLTFTKRP